MSRLSPVAPMNVCKFREESEVARIPSISHLISLVKASHVTEMQPCLMRRLTETS